METAGLVCSEVSCEQKVKIATYLPAPAAQKPEKTSTQTTPQKLEITSTQTTWEATFGKTQQIFMSQAWGGALTPNWGAFVPLMKTNRRTRERDHEALEK